MDHFDVYICFVYGLSLILDIYLHTVFDKAKGRWTN
jgi:hypothetical protein